MTEVLKSSHIKIDVDNLPEISTERPPSPSSMNFPSNPTENYIDQSDNEHSSTENDEKPELEQSHSTLSRFLPTSPSSLFKFPKLQSTLQSTLESSLSIIQHSASGLFNQTQETTKIAKLPPRPIELEREQRIQEEIDFARQFIPKGPQFSIIRPLYCHQIPSEQQHLKLPKLAITNPFSNPFSKSPQQALADVDEDPIPQAALVQMTPEEIEQQQAAAAMMKRRVEEVRLMEEQQRKIDEYRMKNSFFGKHQTQQQRKQQLQNDYGCDDESINNLGSVDDSEFHASSRLQQSNEDDDLSSLSHELQRRLRRARGLTVNSDDSDDEIDDKNVDGAVKNIIKSYNATHKHLRSSPFSSPAPPTSRVVENSTHTKLFLVQDDHISSVPSDVMNSDQQQLNSEGMEVSPSGQPFEQSNEMPSLSVTIVSPLDKVLAASEQLRQLRRKQSTTLSTPVQIQHDVEYVDTIDNFGNSDSPLEHSPGSMSSSLNCVDTRNGYQAQSTSCEEDNGDDEEEELAVQGFSLFAF